MDIAIADGKLVIMGGKLGLGMACCGCCCIEGEADKTINTREDCEGQGGTWNAGLPCDDFPSCSECFDCGVLPEGMKITCEASLTLPPPFNNLDCQEIGPYEAAGDFSPLSSHLWQFEAEPNVNGVDILMVVQVFCGPSSRCEAKSVWGCACFINSMDSQNACGPICGAYAGFAIQGMPSLESEIVDGACVPKSQQTLSGSYDVDGLGSCVGSYSITISVVPE
jgi:hypothetical protein